MVQLWHCICRQRQPSELSLHDVQWLRYLETGVQPESVVNKHPWMLKTYMFSYTWYGPHWDKSQLILKKNIFLISFSSFSPFTHTHKHTQIKLEKKKCNIATPDSIHQCPWHWQRSNSEFLQLKTNESRNTSMVASWIAWFFNLRTWSKEISWIPER